MKKGILFVLTAAFLASCQQEENEGVASVSVPIRDKSGYAVYSLAVIGEEKRVKQKNMEEIAKVLMDSARGLEGARSQTE